MARPVSFYHQIQQGAPYDLSLFADSSFPRLLAESGHAASEVRLYAVGRIVLWSPSLEPYAASRPTRSSDRSASLSPTPSMRPMENAPRSPCGQFVLPARP